MSRVRAVPLGVLLVIALVPVVAGCDQGTADSREAAQRTTSAQGTPTAPPDRGVRESVPESGGLIPSGALPPVAVEVAPGVQVVTPVRTAAVEATERFAVTLTRWLYGDRRRLEVEPVTPELAREIDRDPPASIPRDQRNTDQGRIRDISLAIQTERSGVVAVTVNDLRTDIHLFAQVELRDGRWVVVRFNDD
ncbi:MAG: hypothetical protein MSC31_18325 [Solirubrobacteraceae bacterium MAG38_C4-C5]|nr:hypothetical protein [Candidatus Siliceabacter maunaloa]